MSTGTCCVMRARRCYDQADWIELFTYRCRTLPHAKKYSGSSFARCPLQTTQTWMRLLPELTDIPVQRYFALSNLFQFIYQYIHVKCECKFNSNFCCNCWSFLEHFVLIHSYRWQQCVGKLLSVLCRRTLTSRALMQDTLKLPWKPLLQEQLIASQISTLSSHKRAVYTAFNGQL